VVLRLRHLEPLLPELGQGEEEAEPADDQAADDEATLEVEGDDVQGGGLRWNKWDDENYGKGQILLVLSSDLFR
jgi:hypothetical protein